MWFLFQTMPHTGLWPILHTVHCLSTSYDYCYTTSGFYSGAIFFLYIFLCWFGHCAARIICASKLSVMMRNHGNGPIKSYFEDRKYFVEIGNCVSDQMATTCGVPQGSTLEPLLFNLYMLPLGQLICSCVLPQLCRWHSDLRFTDGRRTWSCRFIVSMQLSEKFSQH